MFALAFIHVFRPAVAVTLPDADPGSAKDVFRQFWKSGMCVAGLVFAAVLSLWLTGKIGSQLIMDWGKVAACLGNGFMGWATWFALWDGQSSWDGTRPDEIARSGIFRCLITIGILLSVFGGGWWQ